MRQSCHAAEGRFPRVTPVQVSAAVVSQHVTESASTGQNVSQGMKTEHDSQVREEEQDYPWRGTPPHVPEEQ